LSPTAGDFLECAVQVNKKSQRPLQLLEGEAEGTSSQKAEKSQDLIEELLAWNGPFSCGITRWTRMQMAILKGTTDCSRSLEAGKLMKGMMLRYFNQHENIYCIKYIMSLWNNSECKPEKASGHCGTSFMIPTSFSCKKACTANTHGTYGISHVWRTYRALKPEVWG